MLPILYPPDAVQADFGYNGLGYITTATKCEVTETRNGAYELELTLLLSDRLADQVVPTAFIKCLANGSDSLQIFEIYSIKKTRQQIQANAQHIRYRLNANVFTEPYTPSADKTPTEVWNDINSSSLLSFTNPFSFSSDITTTSRPKAAASAPIRLGEFMFGVDGSMLDHYGGEYHFNNFTVQLLHQRGTERPITLRAGSGIRDLGYEADVENAYTHIVPYAIVPLREQTGTDEYRYIDDYYVYLDDPVSTSNTSLQYDKALSYDFTQAFSTQYPGAGLIAVTGTRIPTSASWIDARAKLTALTNAYISQNADTLRGLDINLDVDTLAEQDDLQQVELCDILSVNFAPLGISTRAKVVKLTYDVLREKNIKIELGNVKKSMAKLFSSVNFGGK